MAPFAFCALGSRTTAVAVKAGYLWPTAGGGLGGVGADEAGPAVHQENRIRFK